MAIFEGVVFKSGDTQLEIIKLPKNKQPALYLSNDGGINLEQLARFKDDDSAFKFVCYLDTIVTAVRRQTLSIAGIVSD